MDNTSKKRASSQIPSYMGGARTSRSAAQEEVKIFGKKPNNFGKHFVDKYETNREGESNVNKNKDPPTYKKLIELFIEFDSDNSGELEENERNELAKRTFEGKDRNARDKFKEILNFAAGVDDKIDIYEWLIINYLFETVDSSNFASNWTLKQKKKNYEKFVGKARENIPNITKKYKEIKSEQIFKKPITPRTSGTPRLPSISSVSRPPQAPPLTARTSTAKKFFTKEMGKKIKLRVEKKIELVQKFNENLEEFKGDYEVIKEIIKINSIGYDIIFTNINSPQNITSKLNEIINKENNKKCEKLINQSNIKNLNNDDLDESIKIFILLCYYINKINCILNKFDDVLKKDYKSNQRFNIKNNIEYLQIILKKIIKQRNNINKKNEKINSELKINDEEMNDICKNINTILNKIKEIFIGIHNDLNIKLIEEIIPEDEFNRLRRNTAATRIEGTNKNAHKTLKDNIRNYKDLSDKIKNINTLIDNLNVKEYSGVKLDNNNIKNYVDIYLLLIKESFSTTPRGKLIRDKSKQKILRSIVNLIVTNYEKISYPEYKFLDADKIYEKKSN